MRYNALSVIKNGLRGNIDWTRAWRDPEPKPAYDVIVIGGGGHGLATAYYLAKNHGVKNVAVIEKGWLGGGNAGRNTTIVRSNYMMPGNREFYSFSLKLWEDLSHELNYNVMFSQRAHINLVFSPAQRDALARRYNTMLLDGDDGEWWDRDRLKKRVPHLNMDGRYPIEGAYVQPRAGTARHDAVNWGYARAADALGVDILQNTEVTGFVRKAGRIVGVETNRGEIRAEKIGMAVAGHTSTLAAKAGLGKLPIESHVLQAYVSEPLKPFLDAVVVFGVGHGHFYISQSDKGGLVFGGDLDMHNSYAQAGTLPRYTDVMGCAMNILPATGRIKLLRQWGGVMDMSMDGSPFIDRTEIPGLYLNAGWCYGGFKATPASGWCFAHTIARDEPHEANARLTLSRYREGRQIDETGGGPVPNHH
ncbi:MAG: sarcosine oxidase subunit beta family protein [Rhodobacteraceae bacterium]|nr:MAG: sarcosine oxidase subunit beta family protein [Paracoccaceae bacterium]